MSDEVQTSVPMEHSRRAALARIGLFLSVFAVLQLSWQALHGSRFERFVVDECTVRPAAYIASLLTPDIGVRAEGSSLRAPGGGLNILNGCEGIEALLLLLAAFAVAPVSSRSRALGMLCGVAVVFLVNQARVLTLFYAFRADRALFDRLHSTVTPIAVVLFVGAYFYAWSTHAPSNPK
jgi:exosortase/archaeosortase family protein